jgi:carbonic anhydrase/acetyltransferase-like protein (isoleucine patch superfamily)
MPIYSHQSNVPQIAADAYIAPNATVIGDVVVGAASSLWFGTVVRGDVFPIRIGARTNVQDNAVVHVTASRASTSIGDDVTIGHLALIHGCTIGHRCLIGMGSIVLDGAVIEDDCFIAAGALVSPGTRIPAGSLALGRPARVTRPLRAEDFATIAQASASYVQYAREFVANVKLV